MSRLYQIYDLVSRSVIGGIARERNDGPAARAFADACRDTQSALGQHPGDYQLLCIGEQDDSTGAILLGGSFPFVVAEGSLYAREERV